MTFCVLGRISDSNWSVIFHYKILWSDEAVFKSNGNVNFRWGQRKVIKVFQKSASVIIWFLTEILYKPFSVNKAWYGHSVTPCIIKRYRDKFDRVPNKLFLYENGRESHKICHIDIENLYSFPTSRFNHFFPVDTIFSYQLTISIRVNVWSHSSAAGCRAHSEGIESLYPLTHLHLIRLLAIGD